MELSRLSFNQITANDWSVREAAMGCVQAGIPYISLWRDKVETTGLAESARIVRDCGLRVSSLCRGGMFPAASALERAARVDDNRRAIDEAAELGAEVLVLVCGAAPDKDLDAARKTVESGIAQIIPYAVEANIKLGIEPLHPVFAGDRSVIVTLAQANDMVQRLTSPQVGVVVDVYHVWWDPALYAEIERAQGHIVGFHVNDWLVPVGIPLTSRGMMGDGVIEIKRMRKAVEAAGYKGPIEVEIMNQEIWNRPYDELLEEIKTRFIQHV
ncbi:sugar phosphate isomerase/epimerase family protein [Alicyclobacillus fodiniaquatilis]|uniref:Sugar phosphate isomerase/epimerase family protein n=1 Tax=Alicyclobacillus fodiniaquatilis TaxID=1661150 RepID=A0ABW4JCH6_9BACL